MKTLLAEDDTKLAATLAQVLRAESFAVDVAHTGEDALYLGEHAEYDCAVLDIGLPVLDGLQVLRRWREKGHGFPVLILTVRDSWIDKEAGFEAGADDYLTKPFLAKELVARLRALVRRANGLNTPVVKCGSLSYHPASGAFHVDGMPLHLTAFETRVLTKLVQHKDCVVEKSRLHESIYQADDQAASNSVEVIISRLRRKIGTTVIETERGLGYRLTARAS